LKKNGTRLLSLLLILTMVLSFAPTAFAAETEIAAPEDEESYGSSWGDWEDWENTDPEPAPVENEQPAEEPAPVEEPAAEEEPALVEEPVAEEEPAEVSYPANTFFYVGGSGLRVVVEAPEGAFPADAEMAVNEVRPDAVQGVVANAGVDGNVVIAADISFRDAEGNELEPEVPVEVAVTAAMPKANDLKVVHIDDNNNVEEVNQLPVDQNATIMGVQNASDARTLKFEAKSFSVYAVVAPGDTGDNARATVNFYGNDQTTPVATVYVKNSDDEAALKMIVYDPGAGDLGDGLLFKGWKISTTNTTDGKDYTIKDTALTIADVRTYLEGMDIKEGDVVNIYAMIFKVYSVTYVAENGVALGSTNIELTQAEDSGSVTVDMAYTPSSSTQNFEGWIAIKGADKIEGYTEGSIIPNKTEITISGNVTLKPYAPYGAWLVFDEVEKGATYCAPQFVKSGEVTKLPRPEEEMSLVGYTFDGWFTEKTGGTKFTFGQPLEDNTTIYAHWTENTEASYTVIIWMQNVEGNGYAFKEALTVEGTVNEIADVVAQGTGDNAVAVVDGTAKSYTGFHLDHFQENVKITSDNTAVVNVYYHRTSYTLTFEAPAGNVVTGTSGTQYGVVNSQLVRVRYDNYNRYWYYTSGNDYYRFDGKRFDSNEWTTVKTITGVYEQNISGQFPIVGTDGKTYDDGDRWLAQNSSIYAADKVLVSIEALQPENTNFRWSDPGSRTLKVMNYYLEVAPGETPEVTRAGVGYKLYKTVSARYWMVTKDEDFVQILGYIQNGSNPAFNSEGIALDDRDYPIATQTINFYYLRDTRTISYWDGSYFDGDGNRLTDEKDRGLLGTDSDILFGANLSEYGPGGDKYKDDLTYKNFTFAGWYVDKSCTTAFDFNTTMPQDGINVYAKWIKNQYRVFLRPNVPEDATDLDWGKPDQKMTFRITAGDKISAPTGLTTEYDMIGWYLDPDCTQVFNAASFVLNDESVTALYDKTLEVNYTDPMNDRGEITGSGYNSDLTGYEGGDRFWITKKLEVYGKWSAKLPGALGINVVYDATEKGTNPPKDDTLYKDNVEAIAQAASTAVSSDEMFLYWVVQKWNGSEYEDTDVKVYPGDHFTVLKANAKIEDIPGASETDEVNKKYIVQLRAEYGPKDAPTDTHIEWFYNDGKGKNAIHSDTGLQINEAVNIFDAQTRTGFTFLGWSKQNEYKADSEEQIKDYADLGEDDLFLKYVPAEGETAASWQAQNDEGTWVAVTQVAADEILPYEALYAVWQCNFKVYHSGVAGGKIEEFTMSDLKADGTFDLTNTPKGLTANTLYGGYYLEGGFKAPAAVNDEIPAYDGDNWTWTKPEETAGNAIVPVDGTTYYIKEVPAAKFLRPYTHYTYSLASGVIGDIFTISAIDDAMYSKVGFVISDPQTGKVVTTLTIKNERGGNSKTLKPDGIFSKRGVTSSDFLTYLKATEFIKEGYEVSQFWVTFDGATVKGTVGRKLTGIDNKSTIGASSVTVSSVPQWN